jgi:hypothetical protein
LPRPCGHPAIRPENGREQIFDIVAINVVAQRAVANDFDEHARDCSGASVAQTGLRDRRASSCLQCALSAARQYAQ